MKQKNILSALLGLWCASVLWITVFSRGVVTDPLYYQPFHTFKMLKTDFCEFGILGNFLGNILLFLPSGILYPIVFQGKWKETLIFSFGVSITIELSQLVFHRGFFEIDDLITNTTGALLGYFIGKTIRMLQRRCRAEKEDLTMISIKYKTPFIYKLHKSYYVLGFHVAVPYTNLTGIEAYEEYEVKKDRKSFNRVIDYASVVPEKGDIDSFISGISDLDRSLLQEQFERYLRFQKEY